jgi:hypothetical protein
MRRLSFIVLAESKSNHECPYEAKKKEIKCIGKMKAMVVTETEIGGYPRATPRS